MLAPPQGHRIVHSYVEWFPTVGDYGAGHVHDAECPGCLGPRWAPDWTLIAQTIARRRDYEQRHQRAGRPA